MLTTWPQRNARPPQRPPSLLSGDEQGLGRHLCVFGRQPAPTPEGFSLVPSPAVRSPHRKTGEVNSRLSNQAWLHRDNTVRFNSLHTLWHLRRRSNHEEQIKTCTFPLYSLATAPCLGTDHSTPSGLGLYADGEVVAAFIPGRVRQLASRGGKFLLSSRQIGVTFVQAGGRKAAQNGSS